MYPSIVPPLTADRRSDDERRLGRLFRRLDPESRRTLLRFAEFLAERGDGAGASPGRDSAQAPDAIREPRPEPRPAGESVVAAIRRLRRIYPMLDTGELLNHASGLMASHVLQGRAAAEVIDDLEALFAKHYEAYREGSD
jgi:hypothetical protein